MLFIRSDGTNIEAPRLREVFGSAGASPSLLTFIANLISILTESAYSAP